MMAVIATVAVLVSMYCLVCGKRTDHRVSSSKNWEHYTCTTCNTTKDYKVK